MLAWLAPAIAVFVADQVTKQWALGRNRPPAERRGPRIRVVRNRRLGPGIPAQPRMVAVLWALAVTGTILGLYLYPPLSSTLPRVALGAAIGGATGNVADVLFRGGAVDFLDLRIWPVFNLADAAIVGGVMVALTMA